jgi:hypothetical protein
MPGFSLSWRIRGQKVLNRKLGRVAFRARLTCALGREATESGSNRATPTTGICFKLAAPSLHLAARSKISVVAH